ncbi:Fatty acid-binding protein [Escovopsis weberi]|uniref:Fatty acid-binding protein n=1 Tax=Escovopsis weberi TaxID=150374 RepID=A0A0M9VUU4_ESCWE|nr:Fatty acid-binding protein [Escovopsis weberi]
MSLKNDAFPSSGAFDRLNDSLKDENNKKDALKAKAIFAFTLTNEKGESASWHIDLKDKGEVGHGLGKKPTATLILADADFGDLTAGKANAQKLYMGGKLKIKGNLMATMKLDPLLKKGQDKAKL